VTSYNLVIADGAVLDGGAQRPGQLPTVGFLGAATAAVANSRVTAFEERLGALGWIAGTCARPASSYVVHRPVRCAAAWALAR
jgi:hypothetical protein